MLRSLRATLCLCVVVGDAYGWQASGLTTLHGPRLYASRAAPAVALAKKKSKSRKPSGASPSSMPPRPADVSVPDTNPADVTSAPGASRPSDSRLDQVLRDAGVTRSSDAAADAAAQKAAGPLSKIPQKGQELLERFFGGGAIVFGSAFLLSGISVAIEAVCKVTGNPLPTALDEVLVQYVEPAMTPSILILFGFSISLGLLKQARASPHRHPNERLAPAINRRSSARATPRASQLQLSSEEGGVLYIEEDE